MVAEYVKESRKPRTIDYYLEGINKDAVIKQIHTLKEKAAVHYHTQSEVCNKQCEIVDGRKGNDGVL